MQSEERRLSRGTSGRAGMGSLRSTFMNLPKRERLALTLHQIEGFDTNAIAEVLGISGGEARGALARGYSRIQQSWKSGRGPGA